ncbi:DNA polymerase III subunit delta [Streptococcus fryi]
MIAIEHIEQLSKSKLGLITVITGEDQGQYALMRQTLMTQIGYDPSDLSYSYFDLSESAYEDAEMDLESLPFFSDEKIVIFDHFLDITTSKKTYLDEHALKRFEAYLDSPLDTTRLILLAPGKLDSKRRIVKLLKRDAQIFEAMPLKEAAFKTYFQKHAHQLGMVFESGVFDQLLVKANFDFGEMTKNIAFLKAYKADGHISQKDIQEAIPRTLSDNIFELIQLVLKHRVDDARQLIKDLRLQGQDDVKLIAVMLGQFRLFLQVKLLASLGKSEAQMIFELSDITGKKINPYQVKFALRDSRVLSVDFLKNSIKTLIETDFQIKTGQFEKEYLFDLALLKIASFEQH